MDRAGPGIGRNKILRTKSGDRTSITKTHWHKTARIMLRPKTGRWKKTDKWWKELHPKVDLLLKATHQIALNKTSSGRII